ncbi:MAG TPA: hypothetical protein VM366_14470 [Anaerolineae bacterium]|nr:hypothetical protein [Anaerolineae bacterium]
MSQIVVILMLVALSLDSLARILSCRALSRPLQRPQRRQPIHDWHTEQRRRERAWLN